MEAITNIQSTRQWLAFAMLALLLFWESVAPFMGFFRKELKGRSRHFLKNILLGTLNAVMVALVFAGLWTFTAAWIFVVAWHLIRFLNSPEMNFPLLWIVLMLSIVNPAVVFLFVIARKSKQERLVWVFLATLALVSLLHQSCSIAFFLLEDELLLNIGSVTGIAAAAVLSVSLYVRGQIQSELTKIAC